MTQESKTRGWMLVSVFAILAASILIYNFLVPAISVDYREGIDDRDRAIDSLTKSLITIQKVNEGLHEELVAARSRSAEIDSILIVETIIHEQTINAIDDLPVDTALRGFADELDRLAKEN